MSPLMTVKIPEFVVPAEPPKVPNGAADPRGITAGPAQVWPAGATVKFQVKLASIMLAGIARSSTPPVPPAIVAVYITPALRGACGVNVAICPVAASSETVAAATGVEAGAGPVTMKVADVTVVGFRRNPEGTVKVALMADAGQTPLALGAGLVDSTETLPAAVAAAATKLHT